MPTGPLIIVYLRLSIKKSLFPVQRVAQIMASRASAKIFSLFFFFDRKILSIFGEKKTLFLQK